MGDDEMMTFLLILALFAGGCIAVELVYQLSALIAELFEED
jgi:hypothetical protein